jgi:hypothetical protein
MFFPALFVSEAGDFPHPLNACRCHTGHPRFCLYPAGAVFLFSKRFFAHRKTFE